MLKYADSECVCLLMNFLVAEVRVGWDCQCWTSASRPPARLSLRLGTANVPLWIWRKKTLFFSSLYALPDSLLWLKSCTDASRGTYSVIMTQPVRAVGWLVEWRSQLSYKILRFPTSLLVTTKWLKHLSGPLIKLFKDNNLWLYFWHFISYWPDDQ